jgi:hypothetical protein
MVGRLLPTPTSLVGKYRCNDAILVADALGASHAMFLKPLIKNLAKSLDSLAGWRV